MYYYKIFLKNKCEGIQLVKSKNMFYREDKFICFEDANNGKNIYINPDHIIKIIESEE